MEDNAQRVRTRDFDWSQLVRNAWGKDWTKPDPGYEFTNRTFDTPKDGGPYSQED
jgi:hypothetical protein